MTKPKFELVCKIEQKKVFLYLKVVSQSFISDMHIESFDLIYCDGSKSNIFIYDNEFPSSLNYTEGMVKFKYDHDMLKSRPIIAKELKLVFSFKDERDVSYYCEATKNIEKMHDKEYAQGKWKTDVFANILDDNTTDGKTIDVEIDNEIIAACAKVSNNPISYMQLDEDGLNRAVRDLLKSALNKYGYSINDQTQQGYGQKGSRSGEIDIQIEKDGIPVAICEGLIHKDGQRLHQHIIKAIGRYNQSGCKKVIIIEYSRTQKFGEFWNKVTMLIDSFSEIDIKDKDTKLMGVKAKKGTFDWQNYKGTFLLVGVNCYKEEL